MNNENEMQAGEQQEDQALQQILELCQSGRPQALEAIAQIVQGLMQRNQAEGQAMQQPKKSFREELSAAYKSQKGNQENE